MRAAEDWTDPRDDRGDGRVVKPTRSKAEVVIFHLNRMWREGLLSRSRPTSIVEVGANAFAAIAREKGADHDARQVLRWAKDRGIKLSEKTITRIALREAQRGYLLGLDERGDRLDLSPEDRVKHRVWMIAAKGETPEERRAAKRERQALKREQDRARKEAARRSSRKPTRAEFVESSVAELARKHGVSRTTIYQWKQSGRLNVTGVNRCGACNIDNTAEQPVNLSVTSLARLLGVSRVTVHRWKSSGILDQKLRERARVTSPGRQAQGDVTRALDIACIERDVRSALSGPAPSRSIPARLSDPDRYAAVIPKVIAMLEAHPVRRVLSDAAAATRHLRA